MPDHFTLSNTRPFYLSRESLRVGLLLTLIVGEGHILNLVYDNYFDPFLFV